VPDLVTPLVDHKIAVKRLNLQSIKSFWYKKVVMPAALFLFILFIGFSSLLHNSHQSSQNLFLESISNVLSSVLTNPLLEGDHMEVSRRVSLIAKKENLNIIVTNHLNQTIFEYPDRLTERNQTETNSFKIIKEIVTLDGRVLGKIKIDIIKNKLFYSNLEILFVMIMVVSLLTILLLIRMFKPILDDTVNLAASIKKSELGDKIHFLETQEVYDSHLTSTSKLLESHKKEVLYNQAQQVAHDIRSPLAALSSVAQQLKELPEEKRLLILSAIQRIDDITNDLAGNHPENLKEIVEAHKNKKNSSTQLISSLIEPVISEKRIQWRSHQEICLESNINESSYGLFANVHSAEFKRIISNLLNNAKEAIDENGHITVSLASDSLNIIISIKDNGRGIPSQVLPKLMSRGFSYEKEKGSGLGLYHAKTTIESWSGDITLTSKENHGTEVKLFLPKEKEPRWFLHQICFDKEKHYEGKYIVILDDDQSIHQIWRSRFVEWKKKHKFQLKHFSSPQEFRQWHSSQENDRNPFLYLCDYEFLNHDENGLDVIKKSGIQNQSILVTSHYEKKEIRERCQKLGLKMIPKTLAGFIPITETSS
jgi:signal transduction histidine kinase